MLKKILMLICLVSQIIFAKQLKVEASDVTYIGEILVLKKTLGLFTGIVKYKKDCEFYVNGLAHGKWSSYYSNGKIKSVENWENGKLNGEYILYNKKGKEIFKTTYLNGRDNGEYKLYHENGKKHIVGRFINGKSDGSWEFYDNSGNLFMKHNYLSNQPNFDQSN